jgi:fumarate hydratase class II
VRFVEYRTEHDSLGPVRVPAAAAWGPQTQRAIENFPISGSPLDTAVVHALVRIKRAAASANASRGIVDAAVARAIVDAATDVLSGAHDDQFPIDVFQTGSGTSTNMNVNEVVAHLASPRLDGRRVHPNDEVNASQSSNDTFPSAVQLAALTSLDGLLVPALRRLGRTLRRKQREFAGVVKAGRTHLMDAAPVTLGQEFGGYAAQVAQSIVRLEGVRERLGALPLGGTAVGTGLNAPEGFARAVVATLARETGLPLREARDHFAAQGAPDALVEVSAQLRGAALALVKIANDVRLMNSGPRTGLGEISVPAVQPGSSIMPGKVNPVIAEAVVQVGAQVVGNDAAVAFAATQGTLELHTAWPVIARNVLESIHLLANAATVFADRCVAGIVADVVRCEQHATASPQVAAALNRELGYDVVAELVQEAQRSGRPVRDLVVERRLLSRRRADELLDPRRLT